MAFAAPVIMMVAMSALELSVPVAIGTGALLGGGLAIAQSAITGQPINPMNVALGAVGGALPGVGGALGGFGGIADALGLGGAAASGGAAAGGIAETAGAAATEAAATAGIAGPGGTAASAAGTIGAGAVDPIYGSTVVGGSPAIGPSSSVPTGAFFSGAGAGGGGGSSFGSLAKSVLDIGGKASSIGNFGLGAMNFAKQLGGAGQQQQPSIGGGFGGRYTTAQGGQYTPYTLEGGLGTSPMAGYLDPAGRFISSKQRQGSLGSLAETILG